jgi:hypothetical protein
MVTLVGFEVYAIVSRHPARFINKLTEKLEADEFAHLDVTGVAPRTPTLYALEELPL